MAAPEKSQETPTLNDDDTEVYGEEHLRAVSELGGTAAGSIVEVIIHPRREIYVLNFISLGLDIEEAADMLSIPRSTARKYLQSLSHKLGGGSREKHVRTAFEWNLLPIDSQKAEPQFEGELTDRDEQVLDLMSLGLTNKEIAQRLGLHVPAVKQTNEKLSSKLGAQNRPHAVRIGIESGRIDISKKDEKDTSVRRHKVSNEPDFLVTGRRPIIFDKRDVGREAQVTATRVEISRALRYLQMKQKIKFPIQEHEPQSIPINLPEIIDKLKAAGFIDSTSKARDGEIEVGVETAVAYTMLFLEKNDRYFSADRVDQTRYLIQLLLKNWQAGAGSRQMGPRPKPLN